MGESIEDRIAALPPLAEAMSARDLSRHKAALLASLGLRGDVIFSITDEGTRVSLYPGGIGSQNYEQRAGHLKAATWPEAITAARAWIANHATVHRDSRIRAMALAIIDLTDQHGRCDRAMLRRREFSDAEIETLRDAACQRAGELAGNAPFSVEG